MRSTPLGLAAIAWIAGCGSASSEGGVCASAGACGAGQACVVSRCRPADAVVTPADTSRLLLEPKDIALLTPARGDPAPTDAIVVGAAAAGSTVLLLRFEATWRDDAEVTSAFLVFDRLEGSPPPRGATAVEAARILEPWSSATTSWGRQPRLGLPRTAGVVRATPSGRFRVDVTRWVREWARRRTDDFGLALSARGDDVFGATFSSGITHGSGPRIEAYVR